MNISDSRNILFGFAHLYQGRKGVVGTSIIGLVFGLIFLASRSLFPGQFLDTAMDLNNQEVGTKIT